ncbi:MAG: hypothetical protein RLZZ353_890 [Actinomycetota bacterium]
MTGPAGAGERFLNVAPVSDGATLRRMTRSHAIRRRAASGALAVALLAAPTVAAAAPVDAAVLAAEEHSRRPLAESPRDQLALVLYGLLGLATVVGFGTLRRQLRGERDQADGGFRWR